MLIEKVAKSSRETRIIVSLSTIAIVAIATYNWIVSPQTNCLYAAKQYEVMVDNAGKKSTVIKNRTHVRKIEIEKLSEEIKKTQDSFFSPGKAKEFFFDLDLVSRQCKCSIDSLNFIEPKITNPEEEKPQGGVTSKNAIISISGKYGNIVEFFRKLGAYSQRISVNNLVIENAGRQNEDVICYMTITIYLIDDKEKLSDEKI